MRAKVAIALLVTASCGCVSVAHGQDQPRGTVVDPVRCADEAAQTYALYLPSAYSSQRTWSVLLAFHPAARGRLMAERYQAAAEKYGYIVAASNNARNGPYEISIAAAQAMGADVSRRFSVDPKRIYLTGMSGGARVALRIALANEAVAGVIASSAGFADNQPRKKVPFALFGTAGTEDFNYIEMRLLDRTLSSPHFLAVFDGGHTLPPEEVATDAIEWLELQAMQSGRRQRDDVLVAQMLDNRRAAIAAASEPATTVYLLQALLRDFHGLADLRAETGRLEELSRRSDVKQALKRERASDEDEVRTLDALLQAEAQLSGDGRLEALTTLRDRMSNMSRIASAAADSPERRRAKRILRAMTARAAMHVQDKEYTAILDQFRTAGR